MATQTASSNMAKKDTRKSVLEVSAKLFAQNGYSSVSYADISQLLNIRKASIHYHFDTKEHLAIALIENFLSGFNLWAKHIVPPESSPSQKIFLLFEMYENVLGKESGICPGGIFGVEWKNLSPAIQEKISELQGRQQEWLSQVIRDGQRTQRWNSTLTADEHAWSLLAQLTGSLQLSRVLKSSPSFSKLAQQAVHCLKTFKQTRGKK